MPFALQRIARWPRRAHPLWLMTAIGERAAALKVHQPPSRRSASSVLRTDQTPLAVGSQHCHAVLVGGLREPARDLFAALDLLEPRAEHDGVCERPWRRTPR